MITQVPLACIGDYRVTDDQTSKLIFTYDFYPRTKNKKSTEEIAIHFCMDKFDWTGFEALF